MTLKRNASWAASVTSTRRTTRQTIFFKISKYKCFSKGARRQLPRILPQMSQKRQILNVYVSICTRAIHISSFTAMPHIARHAKKLYVKNTAWHFCANKTHDNTWVSFFSVFKKIYELYSGIKKQYLPSLPCMYTHIYHTIYLHMYSNYYYLFIYSHSKHLRRDAIKKFKLALYIYG